MLSKPGRKKATRMLGDKYNTYEPDTNGLEIMSHTKLPISFQLFDRAPQQNFPGCDYIVSSAFFKNLILDASTKDRSSL